VQNVNSHTATDAGMAAPPQREPSRTGLDVAELQHLVYALTPQLSSLADASILITGATGWFGVWLLDLLCAADDVLSLGIRITAVSRTPQRFLGRFPQLADPRIVWIETDIRRLEPTGSGFSHVIHAAADSSIKADVLTPLQEFDTIVEGTRRALAAAGSNCKSFLLLSSGAVYGPAKPNQIRFSEDLSGGPDPSTIKSCYAEGKRAAEQLCAIAASTGMPTRIARCFAFVGPHMPLDKHFAIGNFIGDAVAGRPIHVKSDGKPKRSYMYMTDLMRALAVILIDGQIARPYNVGSNVAVTIGELAHCVNRVARGCGVNIEGAVSDPADQYVPDTTRLNTELKSLPEVGLEAAVARTAAWYRVRSIPQVASSAG
jgi:nucleoside-diphosphate-sugar epimerase